MSRLAVYTDTDDLDPTEGVKLLKAAGFEVIKLETHDQKEIAEAAKNAQALLVGYATISKELIDALGSLEVVSNLISLVYFITRNSPSWSSLAHCSFQFAFAFPHLYV